MIDLEGFDVYMSQIIMMKFHNLTTSSGLVLGPTKSSPATYLFILISSTRLSQI